jgi:hypothetical protein
MSNVDNDLKNLNFQYLIVVRECARHQPMEAIWKFNLNARDIERISDMSIEELTQLAACSRAVFTLSPLTATSLDAPPNILAALLPVPEG